MPNLIGTGLDQVSVNGMLGDFAFQNKESVEFTDGSGVLSQFSLAAINATKNITAVDVFVYDTSKDSDGGAWRKRTQHTSWYNEELNTATRGSRKEFPSVAVIVATASTVTIYDGDDASLPMWMVFNSSRTPTLTLLNWYTSGTGSVRSVTMENGLLCMAMGGGVNLLNFISDDIRIAYYVTQYALLRRNIASRNDVGGAISGTQTDGILIAWYETVDIDMVVLPNAPIDPASGLPVPTIAVATGQGVSVIKDTGIVYNLTGPNWSATSASVAFDKNGVLYFTQNNYYWLSCDVKGLNQSYSNLVDGRNYYQASVDTYPFKQISAYNENGWAGYLDPAVSANSDFNLAHYSNYTAPFDRVVRHYNKDRSATFLGTDQLLNYTSSKYNTGWMPGDIKGAWLSDTTQETVVGAELISNGTFNSDLSGWTYTDQDNNMFITYSSGKIRLVRSDSSGTQTNPKQIITTIPGRAYVISYDATLNVSGYNNSIVIISDSVTGQIRDWRPIGSGTHFLEFVATGTQTQIMIAVDYNNDDIEFDNISVRLADSDRSVNNKGLQVFGNITKTPVATGADLVAYSGFSSSNYLKQPPNPGLDFGFGSYTVMFWAKSSTAGAGIAVGRGPSDGAESMCVSLDSAIYGVYFDYGISNTYVYSPNIKSEVIDGQWHFIVCHVTAGKPGVIWWDARKQVLINEASGAAPATFTNDPTWETYIGCGRQPVQPVPYQGSLALVRISASVPSPEQIKKMYEDEKVLFQDNAKAVLYGTSDAVTALAYDDDTRLLHVGTSSGRSVFQGLRRIDNTTTPVARTISAAGGLVAED